MSRIHLRSNTLLLWLSLTAGAVAASISVGCSSSDSGAAGDSGGASAGKGGNKAGAPAGGATDEGDAGTDPGSGGGDDVPTGGTVGSGGGEPTSGGAEPGEGGAAGASEDPNAPAIQRALALISAIKPATSQCPVCHQKSYAGLGIWANITPDTTNGIGAWTDDEIKAAIHDGIGKDGNMLCKTMQNYLFNDDQLNDLVTFLRSLPANPKKITSKCTQ